MPIRGKIGPIISHNTTKHRRNSGNCFTKPPTSETGNLLIPALKMIAANAKRAINKTNAL